MVLSPYRDQRRRTAPLSHSKSVPDLLPESLPLPLPGSPDPSASSEAEQKIRTRTQKYLAKLENKPSPKEDELESILPGYNRILRRPKSSVSSQSFSIRVTDCHNRHWYWSHTHNWIRRIGTYFTLQEARRIATNVNKKHNFAVEIIEVSNSKVVEALKGRFPLNSPQEDI